MRIALALVVPALVAGSLAAGPLGGGPAAALPAPGTPVHLVPHRAVYDLALSSAGGTRSVESARGRIVFEFTGSDCKGWSLQYRQVTVLESGETGSRVSDLRNTTQEAGDGRSFGFRTQTVMDGQAGAPVEGKASRTQDRLDVTLTAPQRARVTAQGEVAFPSSHMKRLIAAARAGETTLAIKVFDGSDDGRKVFDTLAVIGPARGPADAAEAPIRNAMRGMTRWPVTLSYFAPGRGDAKPAYSLAFDLYENGVSGALRLDYGDFVLGGDAVSLDLLPEAKDCRP